MFRTIALLTLASLVTLTLPGCLIGSSKDERISGQMVSLSEVNAFQPGVTTESEVLDRLGFPSEKMTQTDGTVRYVWQGRKIQESSGAVFLIFGGSSRKTIEQTVTISCKDGIVRSVRVS